MKITIEPTISNSNQHTVTVTSRHDDLMMSDALDLVVAAVYCYFGWGNYYIADALRNKMDALIKEDPDKDEA